MHQVVGQEYSIHPKGPVFELSAFDTADGKTRVLVPGPAFCQLLWSYGFSFWATADGLHLDALREDNFLTGRCDFKGQAWRHVAAVLEPCGRSRLYLDGILVGQRQPKVMIIAR